MQVLSSIAELRKVIAGHRQKLHSIGFVPTMGNLHRGHLKLVDAARAQCDITLCSIFVNPLQFGVNEDLAAYPRTPEEDKVALQGTSCDYLFSPTVSEMYPQGRDDHIKVTTSEIGDLLCGKSRPGHFDGVATVVSKLFNLCQPDKAYFGLKDYQQYLIILKLVQDLQFPIEICGIETEREHSGLAMSSRNNYLSPAQRQQAATLYHCLQESKAQLLSGQRDFEIIENASRASLQNAGLRPDYYSICNATTLKPATAFDRELVILAAVFLGKTRLIDNIRLRLT
jgi:pantoate--beta-alanine ligase